MDRDSFSELYYVYMMTNFGNSVIYTGMTSDLKQRVFAHRNKLVAGFTKRYNAVKLVYFEVSESQEGALYREKQIKAGSRKDKIDLINSMNPDWHDLYEEVLD